MFKMVREAVKACPDDLWGKRGKEPAFWHQAYHTLVSVDLYLRESLEACKPDPRFDAKAHDLAYKPPKCASREDILRYLDKVSRRCTRRLKQLADANFAGKNPFHWTGPTWVHHMVYNLRHAQHHVGVMNSMLRRNGAEPVDWICSG